jgi:hypothetical protein
MPGRCGARGARRPTPAPASAWASSGATDTLWIGEPCEGVGPRELQPIDGACLELGRGVVKVSGYFVGDFSFA